MKALENEATAYWIAYLLWSWLAKTGEKNKRSWPGWSKWDRVYSDSRISDCPLCTVYSLHGGCSKCFMRCTPLWDPYNTRYMPNEPDSLQECMRKGSVYHSWQRENSVDARKKYARKLRDGFRGIHKHLIIKRY